jgi:hypothetical protein
MDINQNPKYDVDKRGRIFNRSSGEVIPDDEPVFILRARDRWAIDVLLHYQGLCQDREHRLAVERRIEEFDRFQDENAERMKEPDTD